MSRRPDQVPGAPVVVEEDGWWLVWLGSPLAGAGLGWFLPALADLVARLPFGPFGGVRWLLDQLPDPVASPVLAAAGALAGLAAAGAMAQERVSLVVSREQVVLVRGGRQAAAVERSEVATAFRDGKSLVLRGRAGDDLLRERVDLRNDLVRQALEAHGYVYLDADPGPSPQRG